MSFPELTPLILPSDYHSTSGILDKRGSSKALNCPGEASWALDEGGQPSSWGRAVDTQLLTSLGKATAGKNLLQE